MIKGLFKFLIMISAVVWFFVGTSNYMKKASSVRRLEEIEKETIGSTHLENPRVKDVQRTLSTLKYYSGTIDGVMGKQTRSAISRFQRANGLPETGMVDRKTLAQMNKQGLAVSHRHQGIRSSDVARIGERKDRVQQKMENSSMAAADKGKERLITEGKKADRVRNIQTALKSAGFYKGNIDGKFGQGTRRAIKEFQLSKNLKADGVVGKKTWNELKPFLKE